ncbi:MAG: hypothetical protein QOE61_3563 [Micromonosporaceae bacterium]|nr:hypothetical protein [Micromonosporaceae bacterium]
MEVRKPGRSRAKGGCRTARPAPIVRAARPSRARAPRRPRTPTGAPRRAPAAAHRSADGRTGGSGRGRRCPQQQATTEQQQPVDHVSPVGGPAGYRCGNLEQQVPEERQRDQRSTRPPGPDRRRAPAPRRGQRRHRGEHTTQGDRAPLESRALSIIGHSCVRVRSGSVRNGLPLPRRESARWSCGLGGSALSGCQPGDCREPSTT